MLPTATDPEVVTGLSGLGCFGSMPDTRPKAWTSATIAVEA